MSDKVHYWSDIAELTHATQVAEFGFCTCEDNEGNENPYADCPKEEKVYWVQVTNYYKIDASSEEEARDNLEKYMDGDYTVGVRHKDTEFEIEEVI